MAYAGYSKLNALIVDDFDSFRMTVSKMLQDFGIQNVDSAVNGADALRYCRQKSYDLILCDHNLGKGKTGQQVLEDLRHHKLLASSALFILVSAESSKSIVLAAYDYEPDAYLTKPVTPKSLQQRLDRLLSQRAQMSAIYRAINHQQTDVAIALCQKEIDRDGRCAAHCQKLLGELYLQTEQFSAAEAAYRLVLEMRALDWAQVGMARARKGQGDLLSARQWLEEALANNPLCMKAYDVMGDICREQGDMTGLQKVLERAVDISPLAILRQQHLGEVALHNHDMVAAAQAYRRAVRLGENSCYDQPDTHLHFARTAVALYRYDKSLAKSLAREVQKVLGDFETRFGKSPETHLQIQLLDAELSARQGDKRRAEQLLSEVRKVLFSGELDAGIDTQLDLVSACRAMDNNLEGQAVLDELVERYQGQEAALEKIDRLLEEPLSARNRKLVAAINNKGIACYEAADYQGAIACFEDALRTFPNHVGIHLNLIQALADKLEQQGHDGLALELARLTLKQVETLITAAHEQFRRYRQLHDRIRQCERGQAKSDHREE